MRLIVLSLALCLSFSSAYSIDEAPPPVEKKVVEKEGRWLEWLASGLGVVWSEAWSCAKEEAEYELFLLEQRRRKQEELRRKKEQ